MGNHEVQSWYPGRGGCVCVWGGGCLSVKFILVSSVRYYFNRLSERDGRRR